MIDRLYKICIANFRETVVLFVLSSFSINNLCFAIFFSRDLPDPGIEPRSPALQADALTSEPPGKPGLESSRQFPQLV